MKTSEPEDEELCMCSAHNAHLPIPPRQLKQGRLARVHANPTLPYITWGLIQDLQIEGISKLKGDPQSIENFIA